MGCCRLELTEQGLPGGLQVLGCEFTKKEIESILIEQPVILYVAFHEPEKYGQAVNTSHATCLLSVNQASLSDTVTSINSSSTVDPALA